MNMQKALRKIQQLYFSNRRFLYLCRLHRPADIPLFLLPALWASVLAAEGTPDIGATLSLLFAALLFRCAAWVFNDWIESRLLAKAPESFNSRRLVEARESQLLFSALMLIAFLLILPLGLPLLYYAAVACLLLAGYPFIKTRLLLAQPYLALCYAWIVPMAWTAQGVQPGKGAWLIFTAVLLWSTAFTTLYAIPRRNYEQDVGIGSLAQIFGENSWMLIMGSQLGAILALWLAARQLQLEIFFDIALVVTLLLLPYQQWLLFSHPKSGAMRSYLSQIWFGIAVFCGIAFHYLCQCQNI